MERYDLVYQLYDEFDTDQLREYQEFVDLFPAIDSRVALDHWQEANNTLEAKKDDIRRVFTAGETLATVGARVSREQAFTALDLESKYGRSVNVLVLDVDETLRSAGSTDNEIPRETLHMLTEFADNGIPIVICTGQTLENVKGFAIQGLGSELVHSGDLSIVYEAGTGVFTPGHGEDTKQLLYQDLDADIQSVFDELRARILPDAPESIRRGCHLQGNEFNVTLKPNYETGSKRARTVIDEGLVYELELLASAVEHATGEEGLSGPTRAFYADQDPEIRTVLEAQGAYPEADAGDLPDSVRSVLERIDVAYYEADAAEIGSLELNKVAGVESAYSVLGIDDPFALIMGDSKTDLRMMRWAAEHDAGIGAAPEHASSDTLEFVLETDGLVFTEGKSVDILRTAYALNCFARLE